MKKWIAAAMIVPAWIFFQARPLEAAPGVVIGAGKTVQLNYILKSGNEVVDTTEGRGPMTFVFGAGAVMPGLEKAISGLKAGDRKSLVLTPEEGFGEPDSRRVVEVPLAGFGERKIEKGMVLYLAGPQHSEHRGVVRKVGKQTVLMDFNHPLAGKELNFEIEILDVRE